MNCELKNLMGENIYYSYCRRKDTLIKIWKGKCCQKYIYLAILDIRMHFFVNELKSKLKVHWGWIMSIKCLLTFFCRRKDTFIKIWKDKCYQKYIYLAILDIRMHFFVTELKSKLKIHIHQGWIVNKKTLLLSMLWVIILL